MNTLARELRKELEKTVLKARHEAENGARKALEEYAVHEPVPYGFMDHQRQQLRERLRARGLQAGDVRGKDGSQAIQHLCAEFGYEHWHRMLFARFLAENNLLIPPGQEPGKEIAISLDECRQMANEEMKDWITMASEYAQRMLPAIFRADDPVLELSLPLESRNKLETWLKELPPEVFLADDSLGWVYQFWQAKMKDEINDSGVKIGADEIASVTQLFTEDYMVLFLLHNTLGAWWAVKRKAEGKSHELLGYDWTYLRFKDDGTPAAGSFEGWPNLARDLKILDPCMGSGHFLVFALPILVGFRMEEEGLSKREAITAVLRENLRGLEIDPRCTQIAAFNLALAAWRVAGGYFSLPQLNLACSGLCINAKEEDWVKLAGKDLLLRETMKDLYQLFRQAPILGSLIDPPRVGGHLFSSTFEKARPLLDEALAAEHKDSVESELAVTARGLVHAARILGAGCTLVITNVPYLGYKKQAPALKAFVDSQYSSARYDLSTCFIERCLHISERNGTIAIVTPHNWLFLGSYDKLRRSLLRTTYWNVIARLGARAFETISGEIVNVVLCVITNTRAQNASVLGLDVGGEQDARKKATALATLPCLQFNQQSQLDNPDSRIDFSGDTRKNLLSEHAISMRGIVSGDSDRWMRKFWEFANIADGWRCLQTTVKRTSTYDGREGVIDWRQHGAGMLRPGTENEAYGKAGVAIGQMGALPATLFSGELYDNNTGVIVPLKEDDLPALWAFCSSDQFSKEVRKIDQALKVTNASLIKVRFELSQWRARAAQQYPNGLPKPHSDDPTQWLFNGYPAGSDLALQVAVAQLVGYRWPRQTGSSFPDCPALGEDGLEQFGANDGIVCLSPLQGVPSAADRLRALLATAFGTQWPAKQQELLKQADANSTTVEDWLRDEFFAQHCDVFHHRPFIWHISDGLDQGFHALVNYHKLAEANGGGRRTLEKLTYSYLGDWIERQRNQQKQGIAGSDARLASAIHLQDELKMILAGDKPYDIFVRWKPLHEQPIGWEPDINDGVRLSIRPFITARPLAGKRKNACILRVRPGSSLNWKKDRGTEPLREKHDYPWFWGWNEQAEDFTAGEEFDGNRWNDLHYSLAFKAAARQKHESGQQKKVQFA